MAPTLADGDYIIALSDDVCAQPPAVGSVIVVRHPDLGVIVKRVVSVEDGGLTIGGDNPMSIASKSLGHVEESQIIGRALLRVPKKGRPRRIVKRAVERRSISSFFTAFFG